MTKNELIFKKIYLSSQLFKMLIAFFLFFALTVSGYFYLQIYALEGVRKASLQKLELEREIKQGITAKSEMPDLTKKTITEKEEYDKTLQAFSSDRKINELLAEISKLGTSYGLKFLYFKPEANENKGFYAAIPVNISVIGNFHQLGNFLSGIANLPGTVVVVNPMSMTKEKNHSHLLTLQFTATIYHTL